MMTSKCTMMKKLIAIFFICSLVCSNINSMAVSAATTTTTSSADDIDWSNATELKTSGMYVMPSGNYILKSDLSASQPYIINTGVTVNLNLNGFTLTNVCNMEDYAVFDGDVYTDSIIFINGGTLNLYDDSGTQYYWDADSGSIKEGVLTNEDGTASDDTSYNFTGGAITGGVNTKNLLGGAGVCVSAGTFNMYGGNIVGNTTTADGILGAGVYVNTGAKFYMDGGSIIGNTCAGNAGGVYNKGTTTIDGGVISRNSANGTSNYGGGMYNAATMYINGGTIQYNTALGGGGISNVGTLTMTGGTISNNYTTGSSGGVLIGWAATFNMSGGEISNNTTLGTAGGVGLKTYKGVFNMSGGVITGNKSNSYGAGVQMTNGDGFYVSGDAYVYDNYMSNGTLSNVWLGADYYMTQTGDLTYTIGVTKEGGTGLVAVSGTNYTIDKEETQKYLADEDYYEIWDIDDTEDNLQYDTTFSEADDKVYLRVERVIEGADTEVVYQEEAYDITTLGLFNLTGLGDATYTVTELTGTGTFDSTTNKLDVSKVGTFLVEVETAYNITEVPTTGSAILTVTPKGVTISDLVTYERGPIEDNLYVDLDTSYGTISGIEGDDQVSIYYYDALATIDNVNYDTSTTLNSVGKEDFAVTVDHLYLAGDDSENYYIIEIKPTTVTINIDIPYIAWPTATDLVYGDTQNDSQLIGGKVIIKIKGGDYVELTANGEYEAQGSFQWVEDNASVENVGEKSYSVQFVIDSSSYYKDYNETISAITQDITYSVNAAPVVFTIEGDIVQDNGTEDTQIPTVTAYYGDTVISSQYYTLLYGQKDEGTGAVTILEGEPSGAGIYYVYASFDTENYRHAGTTVSTGKQIGAFTIYAVGSTAASVSTYTVTFQYPDGSIAYEQITGAQEQDIHVLPSLGEDSGYYAWKTTKTEAVYEFESRMTQQAYDMVLTAVPNPTIYTVSGTITGTDLDGTENDKLDDIAVVLMQGNNLIASTVTDDNGYYEFHVEEGLYTIVVTRDQGVRNEISTYLDVSETTSDENGIITFDLTLPDIRQNTVLNVAAGLPDITVENMDSFFKYNEGENTFTIDISGIDIENAEKEIYDEMMKVAVVDGFDGDTLKEFFEITYYERPEGDKTEFTYTDELLVYHIPLSGIYQEYNYYTVYRYNDGDVETITTVANASGEYMELAEDGQSIILHIKQADIYGIAFTEDEVTVKAGTDVTKVYQEEAFDVSALGMFDNLGITRTDGAYSVEAITGEGTFDGSKSLDVTSIGTFEVTLEFPETDSYHREIYTAILTVTPKGVTIEDLVAIDQEPVTDDTSVDLDLHYGVITGLVNDDAVTIDYDEYEANIIENIIEGIGIEYTDFGYYTDLDYYTDEDRDIDGNATFDVNVENLTLTGEDAHNYYIEEIKNTDVLIYFSIPSIAWPTATNLTYLDQELPELNGGKVVIQDQEGYYTDITDQGEFKWVDENGNILTTFDANFTGDTSLYVMFVEYDETASGGYHDMLQTMIEPVTFKIETAPVEFVIENNSYEEGSENGISITAYYNGVKLDEDEYYIMYTGGDIVGIQYYEAPTEAGNYLVYAAFDVYDDVYLYNHIGTQESTGKQIGSLYIYESGSEPETYTVTFVDEDGKEFEELTITDANYQDIHILPELGTEYSGWEAEDGSVYDFNARFPQPESNVTLTAVEAPDDVTISGTVTGTDLNYYTDIPISNISVMLYSGGEIVATTTTDTEGYYEFTVPAGRYTLVFNRDQHGYENQESIFIDATEGSEEYDLVFPDLEQLIVLDIDASLPAITIDGLDYFKNYYESSYTHIDITAVEVKSDGTEDDTTNITNVAYEDGYTADTLKIYFNIEIDQTIYHSDEDSDTISITDLNTYLLTFYVPLSGIYQGKESYIVYREHDVNGDGVIDSDTDIQTLTYDANEDGEYIELTPDGQTLMIVANKFSVYAIGFTETTELDIPTMGVNLGLMVPIAFLGGGSALLLIKKSKRKKYYNPKKVR